MIIHIRIPKTGSTTFFNFLSANFQGENRYIWNDTEAIHKFNNLPLSDKHSARHLISMHDRDKVHLITGQHFNFGLHRLLPGKHQYVTMLRNPVDRVISSYYYNESLNNTDNIKNRETLKDYIEYHPGNLQTFMIAGTQSKDMLQQARKNIQEHFSFIGITEEFETSTLMYSLIQKLPLTPFIKCNVNKEKGEPEMGIISEIEKKNGIDIQLYQEQRDIFNEKRHILAKQINKRWVQYQHQNEQLAQIIFQLKRDSVLEAAEQTIKKSRKIAFYGASGGFIKEFHRIQASIEPSCEIAVFDSDPDKFGKTVFNFRVQKPDFISQFFPDIVIITSYMFQEILSGLLKYKKETGSQFKILLAEHLHALLQGV